MDDKLPKITYLFGAGASAQVLPTIKNLPERIIYVRDFIADNYIYKEEEKLSVQGLEFKKNDAKSYIIQGLDKLYNLSKNHATIDTYAKKLYLNSKHQSGYELCFFLALYFNIEQKLVGIDPRYDTFLISVLENHWLKFPENLKFLTWNYDLQMELSYERISEGGLFDLTFDTPDDNFKKNEFTSVKINGSCNLKDDFRSSLCPLISTIQTSDVNINDLDFALQYGYSQIMNQNNFYTYHVNIDFSWYKKDKFIVDLAELHNETEILTVIGYSFPFFNREIDRKVIRAMSKLRKIYIQDLYPNEIVFKFLSILPDWKKKGIEIIPIENVTEFFLPPEL